MNFVRSASLAVVFIVTSADARVPKRGEKWWNGLDAPGASAQASGVVALRAPVQGRARLAGGTFLMGATAAELEEALDLCRREIDGTLCEKFVPRFLYETVAHQVTLRAFAIDLTEVSVADYARCVDAGSCARAKFPLGDPRFDRPNFPVTFVTWDDAHAYCAFAGGRLPTEAEWEFAARGEKRRIFPWGNVYNPHLANHGAGLVPASSSADGYESLAPVDAFLDGATPEGILQMAGNVSEWVFDFFMFDLNGLGYASGAETNPTGPKSGVLHLVRGGSYTDSAIWLRATSRTPEVAASPTVGFRCAYDR